MASGKAKNLSILHGLKTEASETSLSSMVNMTLGDVSIRQKPALIQNQLVLSFHELRILVESFCQSITSKMYRPNHESGQQQVVALLNPPSFNRVAAILALFKLGIAYLPVDQDLPEMRLRSMLQETGTKLLLTDREELQRNKIHAVCDECGIDILFCENIQSKTMTENGDSQSKVFNPCSMADPLACILYTSGSTGEPKGVKLHSSNIVNRLHWYWRCFPFAAAGEKGCHKTSLLFVDSLTEILSCVLKGIPIEIIPMDTVKNVDLFIHTLDTSSVTRLVVVPSLLKAMLDVIDVTQPKLKWTSLRCIVCSGEALSEDLAIKVFEVFQKGVTLLNFYGSTETTGDVTCDIFRCAADVKQRQLKKCLSIGKPVDNCKVYILDDKLRVVQTGCSGEICVSGLNIAKGYVLKNGPNTSSTDSSYLTIPNCGSNFIQNMFSTDSVHNILYRMGDIGKIQDGRLFYEGRMDAQVKLRGKRVNLLEIENLIQELEFVERVVVLCCTLKEDHTSQAPWSYDEKIPVAFIKFQNISHTASGSDDRIISHCRKMLPSHMIPELVQIDQFPLQPQTGKVDREALKTLFWQQRISQNLKISADKTFGMGLTKTETVVLSIIAEQLGLPCSKIDICKSFFDQGGSSLSAVSVVAKLNKSGIEIPFTHFLQAFTIRDIAKGFSSDEPMLSKQLGACKIQSEVQQTDQYRVESLHEASDQEDVIDMIAAGFADKNPLDVLAASGKQAVLKLIKSFWKEVLADKLSLTIRDTRLDKVVAACLMLDIRTEIDPEWEKPEVAHINDDVEEPVKRRLLAEGGKWVDSVLLAVHESIPESIAVELVKMIESNSLEMIKDKGYDGIITVNSHPMTAMIAETEFGYKVENEIHVQSYQYQGTRPFAGAHEDYYIKCMTRKVE